MLISLRSNILQLFLCKGKFKSSPHYSSHSSFLPPFLLPLQLTLWTQTCKYNSLYRVDLEGLTLTSENQTKLRVWSGLLFNSLNRNTLVTNCFVF